MPAPKSESENVEHPTEELKPSEEGQKQEVPEASKDDLPEVELSDESGIAEDVSELRQQIHSFAETTKKLQAQNAALVKALKTKDVITDDDEGVETPSNALDERQLVRQEYLDNLAEVMKQNPKYADFDTVLSKASINKTIRLMADAYLEENDGDKIETEAAIRKGIFAKKNPYLYLYDFIKKAIPKSPSKGKAPPSLGAVGGTKTNEGVWSKNRIASMDIMELSASLDKGEIPQSVYDAYLSGQLK